MKENQKKAFDFAADTTKQLITLSTAIITLSVTFSKDIIGGAEISSKTLLVCTWAIFILSIFFGILTLMALTGTLHPIKKPKTLQQEENAEGVTRETTPDPTKDEFYEININNGNIRRFSTIQIGFFVTALIMTAIYGYKSLPKSDIKNPNKDAYMIIRQSTLGADSTVYTDTLYLKK